MINTTRFGVLAFLALAAIQSTAQAASANGYEQAAAAFPMCQAPTTRSYKIQPGFCPDQVAHMIPQYVADDGSCACGPHGIPPVYAAGNWVLVRQSPAGQERVAKFLIDLGAYVPFKAVP